MYHVLKEESNYEDNYYKYCYQLDNYVDLKVHTAKTKHDLEEGIQKMKDDKKIVQELTNENEKLLYGKEIDVGKGLIFAKTGKEVPEKVHRLYA